jgi:hypothetical protein
MRRDFELPEQTHPATLFGREGADREDIIRANGDAIAFPLTPVAVDDRNELASQWLAIRRHVFDSQSHAPGGAPSTC